MIKNYENKKVRVVLNKSLRGFPAGTAFKIAVDKDGTPLKRYWRDRFKDAEKDNCVAMEVEEVHEETTE